MAAKRLLAFTTGLVAGAAVAVKYASRPRDVRWLDYAHLLPHARTSQFRVVNGVRLHLQEKNRSAKETIVLIHGYCSSSYTWSKCLDLIAEAGYRVIAPDLKGFGYSEKPVDNRYRVEDQADLIAGLLDALEVREATLIGNSYGGAVAMVTALRHPQRVRRLVLVNAAYDKTGLPPLPRTYLYYLLRGIVPILMSRRLVKSVMSRLYYNRDVITDEHVDSYFRPLVSASCQAAALATFRQWDLSLLEREMSQIRQPTLIIWGEEDHLLPVRNGAHIHLTIEGSEFIVIPECGHVPQEERPQDFVSLVVDFCKKELV
ncbi:MAG: alpha/beta hydrolase [Acidobacteriota bacterium]|nr:alpha/beta hydrolase [Blastocatellia bacterium]MDW8412328.1 alpha/beta hydrolase [Acidobacteriota bacterium]